jgi:hypothetical protein
MRIALIISFLFSLITSVFANSVVLAWVPMDSNAIGYNLYYGTNSGVYIWVKNCGNVSQSEIDGLIPNVTYYFAATAYDKSNNESVFSNEAIYTVPNTNSITYNYLGMKIDYGISITNLNSIQVMMTQKDAGIPYFYRASLVLAAKPIVGIKPNDGNNYLYLVGNLQFGTNLSSIQSESYDLLSFTNPPANQFYRGSLIITNRAF